MTFDMSRVTFNHRNDQFGVVMEQGRVQLDSDWNEWLAELVRRIHAGTLDTIGRAVYPSTTPYGFHITASGGAILIGAGRMYVDGLLVENHGPADAALWDPALGELSGAPQIPGTPEITVDYTKQPYFPGASLLPGNGPFLAYLDVWRRPITYIEDPNLIDKAVGVDSSGRLQTVWQVGLVDLSNVPGVTCATPDSSIPPWQALIQASAGRLSTDVVTSTPSGPCCLVSNTGYTGVENQLYRVEIHQKGGIGGAGGANFKWSRENGSVAASVSAIATVTNTALKTASQLSVSSLGRDQVLGFAPGNWIEITDDDQELAGFPGELHQIDSIDFAQKKITLDSTVKAASFPLTGGLTDPSRHTRIRRWDQVGKVYEQDGVTVWYDLGASGSTGAIPVPPAGTTLILENGITVSFSLNPSAGSFHTRDFWNFAARTADGSVEKLDSCPPRGIYHHYARLSIVTLPNSAIDCRTEWPPSSTSNEECGCCCTYTVGDGVESVGQYLKINDAIKALPATGGEVCILPGQYFEHVFIEQRRDVVLRGCGWQTRIASPSLKPAPPPPAPAVAVRGNAVSKTATAAPAPPYAAVITVSSSQHVQLLSFAVEAAKDEIGILLDSTGKISAGQQPVPSGNNVTVEAVVIQTPGVVDITAEDLVITASTLPAILANRVTLLQIEKNRIAMQNVRSLWPAVWVSGIEMRIVQNWVGMQTMTVGRLRGAGPDSEWLPVTVTGDLLTQTTASGTSLSSPSVKVPVHPGGIQIAGPSRDVSVLENEIDQAGRNGITLGSVSILDANGNDTGQTSGVTILEEGPCDTTITLHIPGTNPGQSGGKVVASGKLLNIQLDRNRIRNCGLCGIGPVGFFDLGQTPEVISIENLTISANTVSTTLQRPLAALAQRASLFGYGAISVPDVENLVLRDNNVTDFGPLPGASACGIFILHGQMVEISRNHVVESRDWNLTTIDTQPSGGLRGGIVVLLATPPAFTTPASSYSNLLKDTRPVYEPGLPALRVEHNVVRVPLGEALEVVGYGPFSFVNNHFGCGGAVQAAGRPLAETVLILNLGTALEVASASGTFNSVRNGKFVPSSSANRVVAGSPGGAVIFTNNICQLEARASGRRCLSSVLVFSLDDLIFANNQCWLDGPRGTASLDAWLLAGSVQVNGNRFQEALGFPVVVSGLTIGALNITSQNISTYCLFAKGTLQQEIDVNNLVIVSNKQTCDTLARHLNL